MLTRFLSLVFAVAFFHQGVAQNINTAKLDSLLNYFADNNKVMGSVAISKNGTVLYNKAVGARDINGTAVTQADENTKYRIGSISKTFTAVMVFQLIEAGKLSLDTKLSTFFPKIQNADKITMGMLMSHRSGLHSVTDDKDYLKWNTKPITHEAMLKKIEKYKPEFQPDEKAQYSNTNFILLGYIIEKITGQPYANELQTRIAKPLGLTNTYVYGKIDPTKNEAQSFSFSNNQWKAESETDITVPGGAGNIISTPTDLVRFATALFNGNLVTNVSLEQMKNFRDGYGMALLRFPFHDKQALGHTGGIDGFISMLGYFPNDSVAVATTFNGVNYNSNDVIIGILSTYYNMPYEFPSFKTMALSEAQLKRYEGTYSSKDMPLKITLKRDGNVLTAQATGQSAFPLDAVSETEFKFDPAGIKMTFVIPESGAIQTFTLKQGKSYVFTREK
ncbi:MAG TPA: serine hydrolase [Chitinophagales bacterium]|nr:serine hydrolase [Chitinophagales bacterium]